MEQLDGIVRWTDPALEAALLESVSLAVPWPLVEQFSHLVRLSGSPDERHAVGLIMRELEEAGVPHRLYEPECFISIPLEAGVRVDEPNGGRYRAKTASMSVSTDGEEVAGPLVYVPSETGSGAGDVFSAGVELGGNDVAGKIVVTEGMASPGKVSDVMRAGAMAGIFVNPGQAIHEGICTTIWGTPDLDSMARQPTIPVVGVNQPDGQELIAAARRGARVALQTRLDTGWREIPVLVAEIPGTRVPEEFVLVHGHLDSWHVGIGDNATGDATLLELARVFWQHREQLARSLRVAWWSGHSHGRYAGSTWYADTFAVELARNCVAQINCDSPGCRWTTTYDELTAMSEAEPFVDEVIQDVTGITPEPERPPRAGDYSFNGIGITSFYMLSSTMSDEDRAARDYYAVGGCGGNIQWHTEGDTLEVADQDNLLRDMRMYAASVLRTLNAPLAPFDWTQTVAEFAATLDRYQRAAGNEFSFTPAREALGSLAAALRSFYAAAPDDANPASPACRRFNFVQRRLGRLLIPVNYSRTEAFRHDPALNVPPLPDLAPALGLAGAKDDPARRGVLRAHLTRGQNRLIWALEQAEEVVRAALA
ncbi:MAG TPA: M28 family metallopeptidase [Thermomicrobiaceae bacterium]|nr:M28 family metallopeptidase [Thermomicrobiaceae bacterium]